jgi:hypothetical protein
LRVRLPAFEIEFDHGFSLTLTLDTTCDCGHGVAPAPAQQDAPYEECESGCGLHSPTNSVRNVRTLLQRYRLFGMNPLQSK